MVLFGSHSPHVSSSFLESSRHSDLSGYLSRHSSLHVVDKRAVLRFGRVNDDQLSQVASHRNFCSFVVIYTMIFFNGCCFTGKGGNTWKLLVRHSQSANLLFLYGLHLFNFLTAVVYSGCPFGSFLPSNPDGAASLPGLGCQFLQFGPDFRLTAGRMVEQQIMQQEHSNDQLNPRTRIKCSVCCSARLHFRLVFAVDDGNQRWDGIYNRTYVYCQQHNGPRANALFGVRHCVQRCWIYHGTSTGNLSRHSGTCGNYHLARENNRPLFA